MRSILITLAAVAALFVVSVDGSAADYELVGFTSATFDGDQTPRGFTEACQAEFSVDTRMCNSVEVIETVNWPSLPDASFAWTHPVFAPNVGTQTFQLDASGRAVGPSLNGDLSCQAWSTNVAGYYGLTTSTMLGSNTATIGFWDCDATRPVACCGPVPAPAMATVPAIMWFGRGLLAAMLVSAAAAMLLFKGRPLLTSGERELSTRR
jgi:hypothetical protein